jgi:hypothetical protein
LYSRAFSKEESQNLVRVSGEETTSGGDKGKTKQMILMKLMI